MADNDPQVLELQTGPDPVYSIIFLHGLGADCRDFESLPKMLELPVGISIRFVLPDAPMRPITINNGMVIHPAQVVYRVGHGAIDVIHDAENRGSRVVHKQLRDQTVNKNQSVYSEW